jgi:class 3 adenylate cyclase/tetratricopeptide (TPR) repeat protein
MDVTSPPEGHGVERHGVERKIVSVLFADLVGFTTLSERLDPEDVATIQDAYFASVRETIARYGGRLEKFIGDAAMAVFGSPRTRDDDAERAVRAGLALANAIQQVAARVGLEEDELQLRVGVNTGEVVHAESGPDQGRVTGDTVNTAARFQTAAPSGGVLIGETTALAVADSIDLDPAGALELKGKAEPVRAWNALGVLPQRSREHAMGQLRAPTIGRDGELALLANALSRVLAGRSERFVIVAPPGVGKTRLLEEFARHATERSRSPAVEWRARLRPDAVAPYQPIAQLTLAALAGAGMDFREGLPGRAGEVLGARLEAAGVPEGRAKVVTEQALTIIAPSGHGSDVPPSSPGGDRESQFQAWIEALDALAGGASQLWLVEDVHWAGGDVLAFLDLAGRIPSSGGRLVVATSRPSLLERSAEWCEPDETSGVATLQLRPLTPLDSGRLIEALVGDALPSDLAGQLAERSDGNPLFIEELLRTWISVGTLAQDGTGWRLGAPASDVPLPTTVQAIYAGQLDDLPAEAREAARKASVAGRRFAAGALDPLGVADPEKAMEPLVRRALVGSVAPDPLLGPAYAYRHALLRDAGYASLARAERARLHARLAGWLEEAAGARHGEVAELIATHYASALESAPALAREVADGLGREDARRLAGTWFERAAESALAVAAQDAARTLFRRAIDFTAPEEALDRARRWERLGDATAFAGDMDEGGSALDRAVTLYRAAMNDPVTSEADRRSARSGFARALSSLGMVWDQQLRFEEASQLADDGLRTIGEGDDIETARLLFLRAWSAMMFSLRPEIATDAERAAAIARRHGDPALEMEASDMLFQSVLVEEGKVTLGQMLRHNAEVIRLASGLGSWQRVARAMRLNAGMLAEDRSAESTPWLDQAAEIAEAHGLREELAWVDYGRAEVGFVAGNWDGAWTSGLRAIEVAERNAYHRVAVRTWFVIVAMALARGRGDVLEHADRWFREHESIFPPSPFAKLMHRAIDVRLTAAGLRNAAVPAFDDVVTVWDETQGLGSVWDAADVLAAAWLERGEVANVRAWLEAMSRFHRHPLTSNLGRATHELIQARLELHEGEQMGSVESARRALAAFRRSHARWWVRKALNLLQSAGAATADEVEEAAAIGRSLGIVRA